MAEISYPIIDFSNFIADRTKDFTGREWVFGEIDRWLADPNGPSFFIITGEPGVGKSAIAARLTQIRELAAYHFCIARQIDTIDPFIFAHSLSSQLSHIDSFALGILKSGNITIELEQNIQTNYGQAIGVQINNLVVNAKSGSSAFTQAVLQPLKTLFRGKFDEQLVLLVDALDEAAQYNGEETIIDLLANAGSLPRQVRFVLTSRTEGSVLRYFEDRQIPHFLLDASRQENLRDIRLYTRTQLDASEAMRFQLSEKQISTEAFTDRMTTASQGNFLYVVWLLQGIIAGTQSLDTLDVLPQGLDGIYREFLRNRKTRDEEKWRKIYEPILGVLAAAQAPLNRDLVSQFTGLTMQEVRYGIQDLRQFLEPVSADEGQYFLYHQSIMDWLKDEGRAREFWVDVVPVHRRIIECFEEFLQRSKDWSGCDLYGLKYLPGHLFAAREWKRLTGLLTDFGYVKFRLDATDAYSLINDYDYAKDQRDLFLIQGAIRLSAHVLSHYPEQLQSQLYGRLMNSKSPTIQEITRMLREMENRIWLYPLTPSLTSPDDPLVATLDEDAPSEQEIKALAMTPDGRIAVSASSQNDHPGSEGQEVVSSIRVWDLRQLKMIKKIEALQGRISAIALMPDGKRAIIALEEKLEIWSIEDGVRISCLGNQNCRIDALSISADAKKAISASKRDLTVKSWDIESLKETGSLTCPPFDLIAINADCSFGLGMGYGDGDLFIWDINNGEVIESARVCGDEESYFVLALASDGRHAFICGLDRIMIWDIDKGREVGSLGGHPNEISAIALDKNGTSVLSSSSGSHSTLLYKLEKNMMYKTKGHSSWITALSTSPDESHVISGSADYKLKVWDLKTGKEQYSLNGKSLIDAIAISPDNRYFFWASKFIQLSLWDYERKLEIESMDYFDHTYDTAFTFDSRQVISIHPEEVNIWKIDGTKINKSSIKLPININNLFAISPAGFIISTTKKNQIDVWNLNKGMAKLMLIGHSEQITKIVLSPDGHRLISGSMDKSCKVWDIESGKELVVFKGHAGKVYAIAVTPDGRQVISVSDDNMIKIWNTEDGSEVGSANIYFKNKIISFQPNNDATRAIFLTADALEIWDLKKSTKIASFSGDTPLICYSLAPYNNIITVGESSGRLHFLQFESPYESLISFRKGETR